MALLKVIAHAKGACFSSQRGFRCLTSDSCNCSTGLRGTGTMGQVLEPSVLASPLGEEEALVLQEHFRRFGKWLLVRSVGLRW